MMTNRRAKHIRGFTLLELMVALTVAALLLGVGVPSFRSFIMNSRLISHTNEFVTSINMARSAAVRFQRNATVCLSSNYDAAVPTCDAGTNWTNGWIVWVDRNRNGVPNAGEIIQVHEPLMGSATLVSTGASRFTYDARGFAIVPGGRLMLCDGRVGEMGRVVSVNDAGRTNVSDGACG